MPSEMNLGAADFCTSANLGQQPFDRASRPGRSSRMHLNTAAVSLHQALRYRRINANRPAKPLRTSVPTLKSSGFFIACRNVPPVVCRSAI